MEIKHPNPKLNGWQDFTNYDPVMLDIYGECPPTLMDIMWQGRTSMSDKIWMFANCTKISDEVKRLFAVWCARRYEYMVYDERTKVAISVAEAYAIGKATAEELEKAYTDAKEARDVFGYEDIMVRHVAHSDAGFAAEMAASITRNGMAVALEKIKDILS